MHEHDTGGNQKAAARNPHGKNTTQGGVQRQQKGTRMERTVNAFLEEFFLQPRRDTLTARTAEAISGWTGGIRSRDGCESPTGLNDRANRAQLMIDGILGPKTERSRD